MQTAQHRHASAYAAACQRQGCESALAGKRGGGGNQGAGPEFAHVGRLDFWLTGAALVSLAHYVGKPQVHIGQLCVFVSAR